MSLFLQIILANVVLLLVIFVVQRVSGRLGFGLVGIALIVYCAAFGYMSGRLSLLEGLAPLVGVILLAADLRGKLPRWTLLNLLREGRRSKGSG